MIQVEAAGPDLPDFINIVPNRIISMAEWIFNNCVKVPKEHLGGFVTSDVTALEDYVSSGGFSLNKPYRKLQFFPLPGAPERASKVKLTVLSKLNRQLSSL